MLNTFTSCARARTHTHTILTSRYLNNIKTEVKVKHLQFLMSEMNTANPRIPSPFDTAGIFTLSLTLSLVYSLSRLTNYFQMEMCLDQTGFG